MWLRRTCLCKCTLFRSVAIYANGTDKNKALYACTECAIGQAGCGIAVCFSKGLKRIFCLIVQDMRTPRKMNDAVNLWEVMGERICMGQIRFDIFNRRNPILNMPHDTDN
ncbi:hypothetical protein KU43P_39480 [Pseudomonas sp. KU43P]|nr:hypothetical protein KU43P_39480 [Pseudomonas sp. KU43P]